MTAVEPLILVVDDDPGILDALRMLFESEGYRVQTCAKGDYVEALCDDTGALPDVIVLDVLLSGKDGRTICRTLKGQDATRHIPVVMISAHPAAEQSVKEVGADAFVAKPFAIDVLLDTVEMLLTRRSGEARPAPDA
jgi:DNA-binding response OmpR family regulator